MLSVVQPDDVLVLNGHGGTGAAASIGQADTISCCFASLLAYYLGRRGYRRIEVVGYTGATTAIAKGGSAGAVAIKMKVNEEKEERYALFPLWHKSRVFEHTGKQIAGESVAASRLLLKGRSRVTCAGLLRPAAALSRPR